MKKPEKACINDVQRIQFVSEYQQNLWETTQIRISTLIANASLEFKNLDTRYSWNN